VKVALRPSNAKRLYTDEKSTEKGETIVEQRESKGEKNRKVKRKRGCAATLSDLYPSNCLAWEALTGVYKLQSA